ncbi:cation diffusion facilitator family transporter [Methylobacterium sp. J-067]|uniref:cation diffusion facilitator family transporter n=1 Tax=Methylobacterium sp. J-067 TaxID=2836648 RepID=UPI001FB8F30B|nr:cation diffusion facilitator family transporter [Methylobacterium sp. J-067]MCJ2025792.1 cation diffusion facilitator family transporter [Methylobacterium sp. J-067]
MERSQQAALLSAGIGVAVTALKFYAAWLTGSLALYSDALESIINVVAAAGAFIALRIAAQPADEDHPYGHHKAEFFSAVIEGALIIVAALLILREAYNGFLAPKPLDAPAAGLAINAVAGVVNAAWAWALLRWGREWRSPALIADGRHIFADVLTSIGVLSGVAAVWFTGMPVLDPAIAGLVALNILWSGYRMVRESVDGLMDKAASPEVVGQVRALISQHGEGALEAHDVRTRSAGSATFVDFHLVVPGEMTVAESHCICDRLEDALATTIPGTVVTIHVEPGDKAKARGVPVL